MGEAQLSGQVPKLEEPWAFFKTGSSASFVLPEEIGSSVVLSEKNFKNTHIGVFSDSGKVY